jgi:hypothetical protein
MSYQAKVVLSGILIVLAFDVAASLLSKSFGFPYARASFGSYLLYLGIGYFAARGAATSPLGAAALAAAIAGLADASLGWAISWKLGSGQLPAGMTLTPARWAATAVMVVALAAAVGTVGGVAGRRTVSADAPAA